MDVVINLLKNNYKKSTANTRLLQWLGLGFFLRKNAVNSNLICMFVMVSLEFQATDSKRGNVTCKLKKNKYEKNKSFYILFISKFRIICTRKRIRNIQRQSLYLCKL